MKAIAASLAALLMAAGTTHAADAAGAKKKGYKSKLTRLYDYRWFGETGTWDSGLVNPDGTPRPALDQFAKYAKGRLK